MFSLMLYLIHYLYTAPFPGTLSILVMDNTCILRVDLCIAGLLKGLHRNDGFTREA
jgi:hypothetical protein